METLSNRNFIQWKLYHAFYSGYLFCISMTATAVLHPSFEEEKTPKRKTPFRIHTTFLGAKPKQIQNDTKCIFHNIFSERNFSANFCSRLSHHIGLCLAGKTVKQCPLASQYSDTSFSDFLFQYQNVICGTGFYVPSAYYTFCVAFNSSTFEC